MYDTYVQVRRAVAYLDLLPPTVDLLPPPAFGPMEKIVRRKSVEPRHPGVLACDIDGSVGVPLSIRDRVIESGMRASFFESAQLQLSAARRRIL